MQQVNHRQDSWRNVIFFLIGLLIVLADQFSKAWIKTNLIRGQSLFDIGFFQIIHVRNTGAIFGLFPEHTAILTAVSFLGAVIILLCVFWLPRHLPFLSSTSSKVILGLVFGGTVGNFIDRFFFKEVTDFIAFSFWPAFNVADSAVTVGSIWLGSKLLWMFLNEKHDE